VFANLGIPGHVNVPNPQSFNVQYLPHAQEKPKLRFLDSVQLMWTQCIGIPQIQF